MSKQIISSGTVANDKTGDNLRNSAGKINANFNELYTALGNGSALSVSPVAKSGNYNDLSNKPTIPTDVNQLADSSNLLGGSNINLGAVSQSIIPDTDVTHDLGSNTHRFRDLYLSGNTINLGGSSISSNGQGGVVIDGAITSWTGKYNITGLVDFENSVNIAIGERYVIPDNAAINGRPGPFVNGAYATITYAFGDQPNTYATWDIEYNQNGYVSAITMLTAGSPVQYTDQLEFQWNAPAGTQVTPFLAYATTISPSGIVASTDTIWDDGSKSLYLEKDATGYPISVYGAGWTSDDLTPVTNGSRSRWLILPNSTVLDGINSIGVGVQEDGFNMLLITPTQEKELINPAAPSTSPTFTNLSVSGDLTVTGDIHVSPNSLYLGTMKLSTNDASTLLINNDPISVNSLVNGQSALELTSLGNLNINDYLLISKEVSSNKSYIGKSISYGNVAQHTNVYIDHGELGLSAILDTGFGPNEYSRGTVRVIPALVELISSDDDEPGVQYNAKVEVSYSSGVTISKSTPYNTDSWVFNNTQLTTPGPINLKNNLKIEALDVAGLYEIYQESLAVLNDYFTVVSYTGLGYPASKNSFQQLSRAKATNPLIQDAWITVAKTLEDNYYAWAAATTTLTPSSSGFTINNGDNVGWKFEELTGLQFPDGTKQTTAYTGASPQVINVADDEDFNINVSALGMTSPPGQVESQFTFKSNGDLQLPGNLVIPQDEDFSITTSAYSMGSPPGVFSNNFTFKGNGEFVVPWVIKSQYNYFSIESPDTLRLDAPGTIQLGIMGTEHVNIGSATGPTGSNRVSIQSDNVQILSNPPTSSQGKNGDYQGMIAFDNDYMYYCTAPYNYGTDIWKRVALTGGMW